MALIIDTETNGLTHKEPIEVAWARVSNDLKSKSLVSCRRFKPCEPIEIGAAAVHLIMPCELEGLPPSSEAFSVVPKDDVWIAHNVDFDWEVLGSPDIKRICTLACARKLWPELGCHKLSALYLHLFGMNPANRDRLREAHAADVDVEILFDVMTKVADAAECSSVEDLYSFSEQARIPDVMPFGKHRGTLIKDMPADYVRWLLGQEIEDAYLVKSLRNHFG